MSETAKEATAVCCANFLAPTSMEEPKDAGTLVTDEIYHNSPTGRQSESGVLFLINPIINNCYSFVPGILSIAIGVGMHIYNEIYPNDVFNGVNAYLMDLPYYFPAVWWAFISFYYCWWFRRETMVLRRHLSQPFCRLGVSFMLVATALICDAHQREYPLYRHTLLIIKMVVWEFVIFVALWHIYVTQADRDFMWFNLRWFRNADKNPNAVTWIHPTRTGTPDVSATLYSNFNMKAKNNGPYQQVPTNDPRQYSSPSRAYQGNGK